MSDLLDEKPDALQQKLDNLPTEPGIYKFLDDEDSVLYVGKAKTCASGCAPTSSRAASATAASR